MNRTPMILNPLPPRLTMDEYADFVEAALQTSDRIRAVRQKELEERVRMPFRMPGNKPIAKKGKTGHDL